MSLRTVGPFEESFGVLQVTILGPHTVKGFLKDPRLPQCNNVLSLRHIICEPSDEQSILLQPFDIYL